MAVYGGLWRSIAATEGGRRWKLADRFTAGSLLFVASTSVLFSFGDQLFVAGAAPSATLPLPLPLTELAGYFRVRAVCVRDATAALQRAPCQPLHCNAARPTFAQPSNYFDELQGSESRPLLWAALFQSIRCNSARPPITHRATTTSPLVALWRGRANLLPNNGETLHLSGPLHCADQRARGKMPPRLKIVRILRATHNKPRFVVAASLSLLPVVA